MPMTLLNSQFSSAYADTYQNPFNKNFLIGTNTNTNTKKLLQSIEWNKK